MENTPKINFKKIDWFKGDKILWSIIITISLASILIVYSASSNLQYIVGEGTTFQHLIRHAAFVLGGLLLMRGIIFIKYEYIGLLSIFVLFGAVLVLIYTMLSGNQIEGASAARWLNIGGLSFQPSTFAYLILIIYICRYLTKRNSSEENTLTVWISLFIPVLTVVGLVIKDNGSTGIIILAVSLAVMILGQLPWKYIGQLVGGAAILGALFISLALTGVIKNNRVDTWISRVKVWGGENVDSEVLKAKNYQVDRAKAAIVHGQLTGVGPGKSALKQSLPQSVSDFIFAIIVEEYGLLGSSFLIFLYAVMIVRIVMIASRSSGFFGTILALSIGVMIFVQLAVNIAVAVNIFPVTGQPLPLVSYGGTSMLATYIQLGLVLNISSRIQLLDEEGLGKKQSIEEINDIA